MAARRDVLLLVVGFTLGLGAMSIVRRDPETPQSTGAVAAAPQRRTEPAPFPKADCGKAVDDLNTQLRFKEMLYDHLWEEHFGSPVAWPVDTPHQYTATGFEDVVESALADCDTALRSRGIECAEPPCIAAFLVEGEQQFLPKISECPAWRKAYGDTVTTYTTFFDCGDGTQETVLLLAPYWPSVAEPPDPEDAKNFEKRAGARQKALMDAWACGAD